MACARTTNDVCEWPADQVVRNLDLTNSSDARHLADDAIVAEDLAIRRADAGQGRTTHARDVSEYRRVREECKAQLFAIVARQHGVPVDVVAEAVNDRRGWLDAVVILGFAAVFVLCARWASGFLLRGAIADSRGLAATMVLAAALAAGVVGVMASGVWFGLIESARIGNGHMSYRVERLPLRQHPILTFATAAALFAAVSANQYRKVRS